MRKYLSVLLVAICMFLLPMQVFAAGSGTVGVATDNSTSMNVQYMSDGGLFDPIYYAANNPDVVAVYGNNKNALYQHYLNNGKAEGRKPYQAGERSVVPFSPDILVAPSASQYVGIYMGNRYSAAKGYYFTLTANADNSISIGNKGMAPFYFDHRCPTNAASKVCYYYSSDGQYVLTFVGTTFFMVEAVNGNSLGIIASR